MTENIKEALKYAVDLASWQQVIYNAGSKTFYDTNKVNLKELVTKHYPNPIRLTTLTSLVDYIKSGLNSVLEQRLIINIESETKVNVYTENDEYEKSTLLLAVDSLTSRFMLDEFHSVESFNIGLQTKFIDVHDRETVINFVSALKIEKGAEIIDNGTTQITTIKTGVASVGQAKVPSPVKLTPYRTFREVEQPTSDFILRIKDNARCALFEADGGAWKYEAIQNIKNYLVEQLKEFDNVTILA